MRQCPSATQLANTHSSYNTPIKDRSYLPEWASDSQEAGCGALPAESAPANGHESQGCPVQRIRKHPSATKQPVEFHRLTLWSHLFTSKRFHILFNSLFKVFFNFPSRYLYAIGLASVFSLRWSLPPTLGCIPKQPDSKDITRDSDHHHRGLTPTLGKAPIRRTRTLVTTPSAVLNTTVPTDIKPGDSVLGFSRFTRRY